MKIAMISYRLPCHDAKRGGIERVADDLAQGLSRRGHEVAVWSYDPKPKGALYEVRPLPGGHLFNTWFGCRITAGFLGNFVSCLPDYGSYDALIAHGDSVLLPFRHPRIIRVMHGSALGEALSSTHPVRMVSQLAVYVQEWLTVMGPATCVGVSEGTVRHHPLLRNVIHNGVDRSVFFPGDDSKSSSPSILFVGTLTGRKRGEFLLDLFAKHIRPRFSEAVLQMVCPPGPSMPGVSYHHGIEQSELSRLYRSSWIFASPSTYEGFGLPYLEAMASGTPVIATANSGSMEILGSGEFGRVVSDANFAEELYKLLSDPAARSQLTACGLKRAIQFDLENTIDRYEEILASTP